MRQQQQIAFGTRNQGLKREDDAWKGVEATGMLFYIDNILDQTQGAGLGYHKVSLPRQALSSDFKSITELRGEVTVFGTGLSAEPARTFWDCAQGRGSHGQEVGAGGAGQPETLAPPAAINSNNVAVAGVAAGRCCVARRCCWHL